MNTWSDAQLVSLEGQAVKAFLQGYLTCNSDRIEKNTPTPMTVCNLKGRVVANGWALGDDAQSCWSSTDPWRMRWRHF